MPIPLSRLAWAHLKAVGAISPPRGVSHHTHEHTSRGSGAIRGYVRRPIGDGLGSPRLPLHAWHTSRYRHRRESAHAATCEERLKIGHAIANISTSKYSRCLATRPWWRVSKHLGSAFEPKLEAASILTRLSYSCDLVTSNDYREHMCLNHACSNSLTAAG
jgi:hypothetical protein